MTRTLDEIGFTPNEGQVAVRDVARAIFEPRSASRPEPPSRPAAGEIWRLLAEGDLLGTAVSESAGGMGFGALEVCALLEEQGRHLIPAPILGVVMLAGPAIDRFGTADLREAMLPPLLAGEEVVVPALGFPGPAGILPTVTAREDGHRLRLDGVVDAVAYADQATTFLVPAGASNQSDRFVLLPADAPGVRLEKQQLTSDVPAARLVLESVGCDADAVLDAPVGGDALEWVHRRAVVGTCGLQLGVVDQALRLTAGYVSERRQFGRPIGSFQAVAMQASAAYGELENCRVTTWQAAWALGAEAGVDVDGAVAIAKYWASDGARRVVETAQHLHGGIGVDLDYPLQRCTRWAKDLELTLGGGQAQLARLGDLIAHEGRA